jgi:hypothetical protein
MMMHSFPIGKEELYVTLLLTSMGLTFPADPVLKLLKYQGCMEAGMGIIVIADKMDP